MQSRSTTGGMRCSCSGASSCASVPSCSRPTPLPKRCASASRISLAGRASPLAQSVAPARQGWRRRLGPVRLTPVTGLTSDVRRRAAFGCSQGISIVVITIAAVSQFVAQYCLPAPVAPWPGPACLALPVSAALVRCAALHVHSSDARPVPSLRAARNDSKQRVAVAVLVQCWRAQAVLG